MRTRLWRKTAMKKMAKRNFRTQAIKSVMTLWRRRTRAANGSRSLNRISELKIKSNYVENFDWGVVLAQLV
jgi:hypothetical protein